MVHNPAPFTGTPADKMLGMMSDLLDGLLPSIQDILFIQSAVLESLDIYKPMNVEKQLMAAGNLDVSLQLSCTQCLEAAYLDTSHILSDVLSFVLNPP